MDIQNSPTPCYIIDMGRLRENLELLKRIQDEADCKIILALKGFAAFSTFPLIKKYLVGTTASSVNEALLGKLEFGGEVHVYAPAYSQTDIESIAPIAHHLSFNSVSQFHRYRQYVKETNETTEMALRINPEYSEVDVELYDPCAKNSRLGVTADALIDADLNGITGFHFHTLCEQNAGPLARTLEVVEQKFGRWFNQLKWINFGGGHHITRSDYDTELLIATIKSFRERHDLKVYLEPGEAIALNTGVLVTEVLDIINNGMNIAILDTSATAHMPDVLEMPYRPSVIGATLPDEKMYTYRLGGLTCLAGDIIGDYSFEEPLKVGDRLVFQDMAHYTMVKNNTFNGVSLPSIALWHPESEKLEIVKQFNYNDYRDRLS
ncbi:MAG: carboxynorspermidine decarboxylase [Verrucomicrobia bacterium]|nr:carboxynorspermidine decarboxylase [Verrucomicrobiota bacterium]MDA1067905.1 carboxynorspermidine decarboxylase [Verrucomicrobiota bacterium]